MKPVKDSPPSSKSASRDGYRLKGRRAAHAPVLVVGACLMGSGIAQVAAQANHRVWLYDMREGTARAAKEKLSATLEGLARKGKLSADVVRATLERVEPVDAPEAAAGAKDVVEAIVEDLDAKRTLL